MRVPCTSCGEPVVDGEIRCRMCGTLSPPLPGTSVFAAVDEPDAPSEDQPLDLTWDDQPTTATPWAIPIRDPRVVPSAPMEDRPDVFRAVTYVVVAIAVFAGMVVVAAGALTGGADTGSLTDAASVDERAGEEAAPEEPSAEAPASVTTQATISTSSTSPSTTVPTTTTVEATAESGSDPVPAVSASGSTAPPVPLLASSFRSGWVAQLTSVPASAGDDSLAAAFERVRADAPGAVVTRSDDWPALQPGYWVVVAPGPFGSEDEARSFCARIGRGGDECLARMLTDRR